MLVCLFGNEDIALTRTDCERKILLRRSDVIEGKHPAQTSRQVAQQILRNVSCQRSGSRVARYATVVSCYEQDSHFHPPYSIDLATCKFFLFPEMKLMLKVGLLALFK
jgi:hypothetical protein